MNLMKEWKSVFQGKRRPFPESLSASVLIPNLLSSPSFLEVFSWSLSYQENEWILSKETLPPKLLVGFVFTIYDAWPTLPRT